jgi:hypothetical protein
MIKVTVSIWILLFFVHQMYKIIHDGIRVRLGHYQEILRPAANGNSGHG